LEIDLNRLRLLFSTLLLTVALALPGCASKGLTEGRDLIAAGKTEEGLERLRQGLNEEPDNIELKVYYHSQRERAASQLLQQAQAALDGEQFERAESLLMQALAIHPENPRARDLLASLGAVAEHRKFVDDARKLLKEGKLDQAAGKARLVLSQSVSHAGAQAILREVQAARALEEIRPAELGPAYRKNITLEFRDAPLRSVFDMISRQSGINFVFDKDVRLDTKATLFARNTSVAEAVQMLLTTSQLAQKVVNPNTLLIYPNLPQKQKDYQELVVKSFYLGNADAKNTMAMLRTLVKTKEVFVDERLNMLVMRDTPEAVKLAEKIIAVHDLAEPEVMLDVEVLEIKRGRLLDLGAQYPNQFTLLNAQPATTSTIGLGGVITNTTPSPTVLTVESLRHIARSDVAINPTPTINLKKEDSDVNILANPRIRVKNREKAKIHIGDKVPVITSNTTSTGVVSESVSYLDVGLKLDVEPLVQMQQDVQIRISLEVSNIVREIRSSSGTLTYQIGTRNAGTTLRLRDGETQVLAGLISDEDRSAASRIPGLGDLPLLGRLFSSQRDERNKTEIVLLITPRVLRNVAMNQPALTQFHGGTETSIGAGPLSALASVPDASQVHTMNPNDLPVPEPAIPVQDFIPPPPPPAAVPSSGTLPGVQSKPASGPLVFPPPSQATQLPAGQAEMGHGSP
jgi:general secretion pathway protein D